MKTDIKHLLKVVSLPLAISLILPFTDFLYWGDAKRLPMLKHVWVYWSAWPTVICNSFLLFVIPILIECAVKPRCEFSFQVQGFGATL